mgnify:CR=1 FL=1
MQVRARIRGQCASNVGIKGGQLQLANIDAGLSNTDNLTGWAAISSEQWIDPNAQLVFTRLQRYFEITIGVRIGPISPTHRVVNIDVDILAKFSRSLSGWKLHTADNLSSCHG